MWDSDEDNVSSCVANFLPKCSTALWSDAQSVGIDGFPVLKYDEIDIHLKLDLSLRWMIATNEYCTDYTVLRRVELAAGSN